MNNYPYLRLADDPESPKQRFMIILLALVIFGVILFFLPPKKAHADIVDLKIIAQIESSNNPLAVSHCGAVGTYQIMPVVLSEYNTFNKTNFSRSNLFSAEINEKIAKWYLGKRIPQMLRHYGKAVTTTNCITAYNAGIRAVVKGYLPEETRRYLKKYAKLQGRG